jgi:hypothetical protein
MANALNGNTYYVMEASAAGTSGSYLESKDLIVEAFIVSGTANGNISVYDLSKANGAFAAGDLKLNISVLANTTSVLSLDKVPITFPNGIWVTPAANITATLVLRFKG